ncbi:MAG: hypothetical protein AseanaTS_25720 [Candidatus Pelagadaptatus aseana]|uniref:hypothetical protein n=1 Tax=Candidatus Pelagadaptatus aseana TaxID=3120508 RepID=UPI0039B23741
MERKEPTFSAMDTAHEADDTPILNQQVGNKAAKTGKQSQSPKSPAAKRGTPQTVAAVEKSGGSTLTVIALLVAVIGLGLGGYLYLALEKAQSQLAESNSRLQELQQALVLSGDESTQSVSALQANLISSQKELKKLVADLKESNHEIRKLWDTRNVNKKAIAANKKAIDSTRKSADASASALKPMAGDVKKLQDQLAAQKKALQLVKSDAGQALESATLLSGSIEQQQQRLRDLVDQGNLTSGQLRDLSSQVKAHDEAIRSIDAFRKNTNNEIWKLKQARAPAARPAQ